MILKLKQKLNPKLNPKQNNFKLAFFVLLGCIGQVCLANTIELTIAPKTALFYFSLPSNPTTGYKWSFKSYDKSKLSFHHSSFKVSHSHLMGSGGKEYFFFNVIQPSETLDTILDLNYSRPWETENAQFQRVHIVTKK
jgi:predicted secreted protein